MLQKLLFLFLIYTFPVQYILADGIIKEQSLATTQGKSLNVKSDCGDVIITTWNKSEAYVKISGNDNAKDKMTFDIKEKNGDIYVTAGKSHGISALNNVSLKIEVNIPEIFNTSVATAGGDLSLANLTGSANLKTTGGDIDIKNINGDVNVKTAGGDIKAESLKGNFAAKTAGGNINFSGSDGSIAAKTAGGDITVKYNGDNKGINLKTSGGNINLYLPENISAKVNLSTSNGDIKSDFSITGDVSKSSKQKITGEIGSGGELISCKTSGGDISMQKIK